MTGASYIEDPGCIIYGRKQRPWNLVVLPGLLPKDLITTAGFLFFCVLRKELFCCGFTPTFGAKVEEFLEEVDGSPSPSLRSPWRLGKNSMGSGTQHSSSIPCVQRRAASHLSPDLRALQYLHHISARHRARRPPGESLYAVWQVGYREKKEAERKGTGRCRCRSHRC